MTTRNWLATGLLAIASLAHAQDSATAAAAPASKKELVQRILALQQPVVENLARQLVEQPAGQVLQQAGIELQRRVAADKREAVAAEIQGDARRYVDETLPLVRAQALKVAPEVLAPILEAKMSEDELRQILQVLQQMESPAFRKYNSIAPELQRALNERTVTDTRSSVEPKLRTFRDSVARRLGITQRAAPAPASGASAPKKP